MAEATQATEAIVLAGGLGTRLRQILPDLPKPMANVAGGPFLSYLLDYLMSQGISRAVLAVGYRHETITSYFGTRHGALELDYSIETEQLGTGGGLLQAISRVHGESFFALNGDTFFRLDYRSLQRAAGGAGIAMALRAVPDASRYGSVILEQGRVTGFQAAGVAGPGVVNGGVYWMSRRIFDGFPMPKTFSLERDFLEAKVSQLRPAGVVSDGPFIDIGVPESLAAAQTLLPAWTRPEATKT